MSGVRYFDDVAGMCDVKIKNVGGGETEQDGGERPFYRRPMAVSRSWSAATPGTPQLQLSRHGHRINRLGMRLRIRRSCIDPNITRAQVVLLYRG